jgi:hypothetical protein
VLDIAIGIVAAVTAVMVAFGRRPLGTRTGSSPD